MKSATAALLCLVGAVAVAAKHHPAIDMLERAREQMPQEVKDGKVEQWASEELAKQQQPQAGKPHILVIGDSWAWVVGRGTDSYLMQRLKAHNCDATSACIAIPGSTASEWASEHYLAALKTSAKNADFVFVTLVGNDALHYLPGCAEKGKSAEECTSDVIAQASPNLLTIVDTIHEANPKARVVGFGYDTMFGGFGCSLVTHDVFPQCWSKSIPRGQGDRCFNTHFLNIQGLYDTLAKNRTFVDSASILGATQVAAGDEKASTDPSNRHIDFDAMGPARYWPLDMLCFHPSIGTCHNVNDCGSTVVMEEFHKVYWSKQPSVCPAGTQVVV